MHREHQTIPYLWTICSQNGWISKSTGTDRLFGPCQDGCRTKRMSRFLCIYIRDASSHSRYYTGAIVVHLDLNWISANLFSSSKQSDYTQFYIIDDRGYVIAHSEKKYYGEDWSQRSGVHQILNGNLLDNTEKRKRKNL